MARVSGALLDTSMLIAPLAPERAVELPATAAISVVTLGELHAGVRLARGAARHRRQTRLEAVRRAFIPLLVDEAVAESYGEVLALARSKRRIAKATDLLIIATALATDRRLVTRDVAQARLAEAARIQTDLVV